MNEGGWTLSSNNFTLTAQQALLICDFQAVQVLFMSQMIFVRCKIMLVTLWFVSFDDATLPVMALPGCLCLLRPLVFIVRFIAESTACDDSCSKSQIVSGGAVC